MKKALLIFGSLVGILAIGLVIWFSIAGPVLVEWYYGAICDPPFVILNPLRNREPERVADVFFVELKNGNMDILEHTASDGQRLDHIRSRETERTILSWYAGGRSEGTDDATIVYWINTQYDEGCHTLPASIGLTRINAHWKVTSYNPSY